uniref:hypothetical protein n=1 Tax=Gelidibacter sp. TaxID=2018083 RepID=UPI00404AD405
AHENFEKDQPTIGSDTSFFGMLDEAFNNKISDNIEREDKIYINLDDVEDDDIMEPVMEKIKDIVAQMPQETREVDTIFEQAAPKNLQHDLDEITADFREMPFSIGLNDKLAFIKQLFNGDAQDYERALSQISTTSNYDEAKDLVQNMIKPDYNNWVGKEIFEERFMQIIENKFN